MMGKNGRLKVADFGIARIEDAGLTQANVMIGTPTYMAPEQFLGTSMDRRVDLYACGVLLYILLTGKPPFTGSQEQLMYKVVHEPPVLPSQVEGANRPHFYDAIVSKALAKNPDHRFPSAAAFRDAVQRGVGQPFDTTVWERTLIGVAEKVPAPVKTPGTGSLAGATAGTSGSWTQLPDHWDKAQLKEAEASLAKLVGPLASVLVKRAARECADLPSLYAKLAEQVTNPQARTAFLERATSISAIKGGPASGTRSAPAANGAPLPEALIDAAAKLLANHVGPIARVMAKKTAARTTDRDAYFGLLADAVTDPAARQKLLTELKRLA